MSFYRETMAYLHKLIYIRPHKNIEGADPASDHPLGKNPLGIGDGSFCCRHRGTVMNPERNAVRIEKAIWPLIGSTASLNKVNGASRPATGVYSLSSMGRKCPVRKHDPQVLRP